MTFLRCIFAVGSGCPTPLLYSETGILLMEFRILEKKLMFLHHLNHLPETALAKEVIQSQTELGLPGIAQECHNFLVRFGISDIMQFSKLQFKRIVKTKIRELNKAKLLEQVRSRNYKKIDFDKISSNNFEQKPYLSSLSVPDA